MFAPNTVEIGVVGDTLVPLLVKSKPPCVSSPSAELLRSVASNSGPPFVVQSDSSGRFAQQLIGRSISRRKVRKRVTQCLIIVVAVVGRWRK